METEVTKVVVWAEDFNIEKSIKEELPSNEFEIVLPKTINDTFEYISEKLPHILIFEYSNNRVTYEVTVSLFKKLNPDMKIIVISQKPSISDVKILEQGIFYYMSKFDIATLIEIIYAARLSLLKSKASSPVRKAE